MEISLHALKTDFISLRCSNMTTNNWAHVLGNVAQIGIIVCSGQIHVVVVDLVVGCLFSYPSQTSWREGGLFIFFKQSRWSNGETLSTGANYPGFDPRPHR